MAGSGRGEALQCGGGHGGGDGNSPEAGAGAGAGDGGHLHGDCGEDPCGHCALCGVLIYINILNVR